MSLQTTIKDSIKDAMKNKDMARLMTLRGISSAMTNEAVNLGKGPQGELSDEEVVALITREAKRRKDSISQYTEGGREDLDLPIERQPAQRAQEQLLLGGPHDRLADVQAAHRYLARRRALRWVRQLMVGAIGELAMAGPAQRDAVEVARFLSESVRPFVVRVARAAREAVAAGLTPHPGQVGRRPGRLLGLHDRPHGRRFRDCQKRGVSAEAASSAADRDGPGLA